MTAPTQERRGINPEPTTTQFPHVDLNEGQTARFRMIQDHISNYPGSYHTEDTDMRTFNTNRGVLTAIYYPFREKISFGKPEKSLLFSVHLNEGKRSGYTDDKTVQDTLELLEQAIADEKAPKK